MRVENNLVMVIMGLLAVAVVLLVLYAMYPMLVSWAMSAGRWCCRRRAAHAGGVVMQGGGGDASPPDATARNSVLGRWLTRESAMSIKMGSVSLTREASTAGGHGARGRRNLRSQDRIPNSRGVVWNARVFEGRPTVVTMGAQDPLSDLDSWRYETRYLEAHWHVPSGASSSGDSEEIQGSGAPSSEEALAVVHPMSPTTMDAVSEAIMRQPAGMIAKQMNKDVNKNISAPSEDYSSSSTSSEEEERARRQTLCPSVPPNALLRYVWGARSLATGSPGTSMLTRPDERPPQTVSVYAAGPSPLPGPSRLAVGVGYSPPNTPSGAAQPSHHLPSSSSQDK